MKKGIEQDDVIVINTHSCLAEHDYFCKYPVNDYNLIGNDSGSESETEVQFRDRDSDSCSTTSVNNADTASNLESESESSSDESSSESEEDTNKHVWPWMNNSSVGASSNELIPLNQYDEHVLLEDLETTVKMVPKEKLDRSVYPLYSKLKLRRLKRSKGCSYFNFDDYLRSYHERKRMRKGKRIDSEEATKVKSDPSPRDGIEENTLLSRGIYPDVDFVCSQYTNRTLKPFIWRDTSCRPPYLKVLHELKSKRGVETGPSNSDFISGDSIDYSYLKPQHIQTINNLCCRYFWPGINVTDSLQYPDFSCVALYKKLIVGFAFLEPDFSATETYLTFLFTRPQWRGAGIATFMIYHLINTCVGKDITLHVAADNPAVILYQKFGFKVEQFIQNFYDKYIPIDNQGCKHALFLRLSR
ncbi:cysteine-rich protein 2-binding protein [Nilaparvata lugens]|uniref:cysteine-rich protein 2-binding protein n=1 Tax=Nilaparvata lugens TaxID=108931 RepID=UPI00193C9D21|nr:cysteine-rich protein 2-binding protein [Nilaparvata lugens]